MSARVRYLLMGLAVALLLGALVWSANIRTRDPLRSLADRINEFGFSLAAEDFYVLGGAEGASIASVLREEGSELDEGVSGSLACGFPSDVEATGEITALLANTTAGVVTVYLRDGTIELCFLQTPEGEVKPLQ